MTDRTPPQDRRAAAMSIPSMSAAAMSAAAMSAAAWAGRRVRTPGLDRRGSVTAYVAIMLVVLIGFSGFAVDLQRAWLVQTRLKTAVDAAALAAARDYDAANRDSNARSAYTANVNPSGGTNAAFGATFGTPTVAAEGTNAIRITATATVPKTLFRVISNTALTLTESSVAQRVATGLELAIVLDATGSMAETDTTLGITKMAAAKNAIKTMLDVLYGGADTQRYLWVSVVPFTRTVNIGTTNAARALLNTTSPAMPTGWSFAGWTGCVEARSTSGNYDMNDAAPNTNAGRFRPYFWPSTFNTVGTTATGACSTGTPAEAYGSGSGTRTCFGDNDWGQTAANLASNPMYANYANAGVPSPAGRNLFCSANPILPLTASRATVDEAVDDITVPAKSGGTLIPPGLHAGWLTLAPTWRGYWPGADATLPLDYNTRNMRKVLILLSDGANNWQGWRTDFTNPENGGVLPERSIGELYYSAYGRAAEQRLPFPGGMSTSTRTNIARANTALATRMVAICNAMKASAYNIQIYIIGFEVANATDRGNLQACSSGTDYYFESPSASNLQATFRTIGNRLASLRLSE